jgi:5-methylcytosine-specific restriction protein B
MFRNRGFPCTGMLASHEPEYPGATMGIVEIVQFHPSYAYEDFVEGIRPVAGAEGLQFERKAGHFMRFCEEARRRGAGVPCVLIIDEINRARVSQVFGELMYALEYRERPVRLSSGNELAVPDNVRVIATMNTADRSLALVDHAMRRRFSFIEVPPALDILRAHLARQELPAHRLLNAIEQVNRTIEDPRYAVGISFFMLKHRLLLGELAEVWRGEIEPYLEEYFFDQPEKAKALRWGNILSDHLEDWPSA